MYEAPACARFILRARPAARAAAASLGLSLPVVACRSCVAGSTSALWLGPDEWLLVAPEVEGPVLSTALEEAMVGLPHSLVDIGHRQVGLVLEGSRAAEALNAGCPLDLDVSAFPVGMCTRTIFAKAEIVLWRTKPQEWRIEVWRSFSAYVRGLLQEAERGSNAL